MLKDFSTIRGLDTETINGFARILSLEGLGSFQVRSFDAIVRRLFMYPLNLYVAYNLDYDVSAIVKYLRRPEKALFFDSIPIKIGPYTLKYIPGKRFSISHGRRSIYVYDALQFFGMSLRSASKKYLNREKLDYNVVNLTESDLVNPDFLRYADIDADLAGSLFRWLLSQAPSEFRHIEPLSTGYWSYRYFRNEILSNLPERRFNWLSRRTFRGGRFEIFKRGTFEDVYLYDIRSAYPNELRRLVGIPNGSNYIEGVSARMPYGVFCVDLDIPASVKIAPIQVRLQSGLSCCPVGSLRSVWITEPEYRLVKKLGYLKTVRFAASLESISTERPFAAKVDLLYVLKQQESGGYVYKKILNSLYGKMCQVNRRFRKAKYITESRVNSLRMNQAGDILVQEEEMRFANFAYASTVTANVRLSIYHAMMQAPKSILGCFTDSVLSTIPLDLPLSSVIGEWELKKVDWMLLIGCGVYLYSQDGKTFGRFRGITLPDADSFLEILQRADRGKVRFSSKRRFSFKQLAGMNDYAAENLILDCARELDLNFDRKRIWKKNVSRYSDLQESVESMPILIE
jgi:hypothetical protein